MNTKTRWWTAVLLLAVSASAACRSGASGPPPPPTLTPTPMSTPLPTILPTVAPGSADNPVRFVLISDATGRAATNAADTLQEALQSATDLTLELTLASSDRVAVQALCDAFDGPEALAFVSGLGYAAAEALGCGVPVFLAQDADEAATREIVLIAAEDSDIAALADLTDKTFCRLSATDLDTWQAPSLFMLSRGLPPTSTLREVVDVPDLATLVERVANGDCDAAALALTDYERIADSDMQDTITQLPEPVPGVPLGVVMVAPEMPLGVRETLTEALRDITRTSEGADSLETLAGARRLVSFTDGSLQEWDAFIADTGLDFAGFEG